jgi:hypothetical protein
MAGKKVRRSAFVPRLVVKTAIVSVIPACALACGSSDSPGPAVDAAPDQVAFGVAAVAYPAYEAGAPREASAPSDASTQPDVLFGVAAVAYPAYEAGPPPSDAGVPKDAATDAFHVFALAVTAYEVGKPAKG